MSRSIVVRRALRVGVAAALARGCSDDLQAQSGGAIEGSVFSTVDSLPVRQATVQVLVHPARGTYR